MGLSFRDPALFLPALGLVLAALILVIGWRSPHDEVALGLAVVFLIFGLFGSIRAMGPSRSTFRR